jgi:hypothetical protein
VVLNISIQKREIPTIQLLLHIQRLIINVKRNLILEIIMEPFSSTNSTRTSCLFRKKSDGHQELSRNCRINSCMTPSKRNTSNTHSSPQQLLVLVIEIINRTNIHHNNNNNNNTNNNDDIFKRSCCSSTCHHWRQCLLTVRQIFPSTGKFNKLISTHSPCQRKILSNRI